MKPLLTDCTNALGVPLMYDRSPDGYGVPVPGSRFMGTHDLCTALEGLERDLKKIGWLPYMESVLTAGLYVNKKGAHGKGIAIDIDGAITKPANSKIWNKKVRQIWVYKKGIDGAEIYGDIPYIIDSLGDRTKTRLACLISLRFGVVLTAGYNKAHEDHIHADLSRSVKWQGSRSQVVCLQETLNAWFNADLKVDGILGGKTARVWKGTEGTNKPIAERWIEWLRTIAFNPPKDVK